MYDGSKNTIKWDLKDLQSASYSGKATSNTQDWATTTALTSQDTWCWNRVQTDLFLLFLPFTLAWGWPEGTRWPVFASFLDTVQGFKTWRSHWHILEKEEKVPWNTYTLHLSSATALLVRKECSSYHSQQLCTTPAPLKSPENAPWEPRCALSWNTDSNLSQSVLWMLGSHWQSVCHFCFPSVLHFSWSCWKTFYFIKHAAIHMRVGGGGEDTDNKVSSMLLLRTSRNLYLHLVEE